MELPVAGQPITDFVEGLANGGFIREIQAYAANLGLVNQRGRDEFKGHGKAEFGREARGLIGGLGHAAHSDRQIHRGQYLPSLLGGEPPRAALGDRGLTCFPRPVRIDIGKGRFAAGVAAPPG